MAEDANSAADVFIALSEEELRELINPVDADDPPSLDSFAKEAGKTLCFQVKSDNEKKSVILQQTGKFDWWNRLNAKVGVGYKKVVNVETEPRLQRLCLECDCLSGLRNALRDLRAARVDAKSVGTKGKQAAKDIGTWELASAIVITQTALCKLRVRGNFIRWCEQDMKIADGFKVDVPVCIRAGCAVDVSDTTFMVQVDDGLMISMDDVGRVPKLYNGKQLVCAQYERLEWTENGKVDELKSQWDVGAIGLDSADDHVHKFSASTVTMYLS